MSGKTVTLKWNKAQPVLVPSGITTYQQLVDFAAEHFHLASCKLSLAAPAKGKNTLLSDILKKPNTVVVAIGNEQKHIAAAVGNEDSRISAADDAAEEEEGYEEAHRSLVDRIHSEKWVPESGVELRSGLRLIAYDHPTRAQHLAFVGEVDYLRLHMKGMRATFENAKGMTVELFSSKLVEAAIKGAVIQHGNEMAALSVVRFIIQQRATKPDVVTYLRDRGRDEGAVSPIMVSAAAECGQIHILFYLLCMYGITDWTKETWAQKEPAIVESLAQMVVQDPKQSQQHGMTQNVMLFEDALFALIRGGHLRCFKRLWHHAQRLPRQEGAYAELREIAIRYDRLRTYIWICKQGDQYEPPINDLTVAIQNASAHLADYICRQMAEKDRMQNPLIQQGLQQVIYSSLLSTTSVGKAAIAKRILWTTIGQHLDVKQLHGNTLYRWFSTTVGSRGGRYGRYSSMEVDAELVVFVLYLMQQQRVGHCSFLEPTFSLFASWCQQVQIEQWDEQDTPAGSLQWVFNRSCDHLVDTQRIVSQRVQDHTAAVAQLLKEAGAEDNAAGAITAASSSSPRHMDRAASEEKSAAMVDGDDDDEEMKVASIVLPMSSSSSAAHASLAELRETAKARLQQHQEKVKAVTAAKTRVMQAQNEVQKAQQQLTQRQRIMALLVTHGANCLDTLLPLATMEQLTGLHQSLTQRELQEDLLVDFSASILSVGLRDQGTTIPQKVASMMLHYAYGYDESELPLHRKQLADVWGRLSPVRNVSPPATTVAFSSSSRMSLSSPTHRL